MSVLEWICLGVLVAYPLLQLAHKRKFGHWFRCPECHSMFWWSETRGCARCRLREVAG